MAMLHFTEIKQLTMKNTIPWLSKLEIVLLAKPLSYEDPIVVECSINSGKILYAVRVA